MCGLVACWVGWVLTGDLSGTRTGAVGLTGHSERGDYNVKTLGSNKLFDYVLSLKSKTSPALVTR